MSVPPGFGVVPIPGVGVMLGGAPVPIPGVGVMPVPGLAPVPIPGDGAMKVPPPPPILPPPIPGEGACTSSALRESRASASPEDHCRQDHHQFWMRHDCARVYCSFVLGRLRATSPQCGLKRATE